MSSNSFNCILCTGTFQTRNELQVHFRQHGNPDLHASLKINSKKKEQSTGGTQPSKSLVKSANPVKIEEVSCDVCSEKFITVSKAIRHKHKAHPDYTVKHFCSWCGQFFPIKHLYDKHKSKHAESDVPAEVLRCDECHVDFFTNAAVVYHNRSYHCVTTSGPNVAPSKKCRIVNKALVHVYFCFLCGTEFINSFNLQKHLSDSHTSEEWVEPGGEVLRCPRCDAIFHNQPGYVQHLTSHSNHDVYVNLEEPFPELTEFTLETIPPQVVKMETPLVAEIDTLLSEGFDISASPGSPEPPEQASGSESNPEKQAKPPRKAITLNQFLSMNKDVFGDVFNFQGVEEVPSQVVANQLRQTKPQPRLKPGAKVISAQNIQKLKQQGIAVNVKKPVNVVNKVKIANGVDVRKQLKFSPGAFIQGNVRAPGQNTLMRVARPPGAQAVPIGKPIKVLPGAIKPSTAIRSPFPVVRGVPIRSPGQIKNIVPTRSPVPARMAVPTRSPAPRPIAPVRAPVPIRTNVALRSPAPVKKAPTSEAPVAGPFSCFKKPKESLIPISEVHEISELMKSESAMSSPVAKPNVSPSLASRPVSTPMSVSKPVPKPTQQSISKPTIADVDSNRSKTDEALEKLRKSGLLVKKPKLDGENSRESSSSVDAPSLTMKSGG